MPGKKIYAVRKGKKTGVFYTWEECQNQVKGYPGAEFSSFKLIEDAMQFLDNIGNYDTKISSDIKILDNDIVAYVDGSYDDIKKEYSCGVVLFINGEKVLLSKKDSNKDCIIMRNVAGELLGAMMAMEYAINNNKNNNRLVIYHDYEGISKWCTGEWKTNKAGTKSYKEFYNKISKLIEICFIKVKAHSGDKYNEEADLLAKAALSDAVSLESFDSMDINLVNSNLEDYKQFDIDKNIKMVSRNKQKTQLEIIYKNKKMNTDMIIKKIKEYWKKQNVTRKIGDIITLNIYINIDKLVYEWDMVTVDGVEHGELSFFEFLKR